MSARSIGRPRAAARGWVSASFFVRSHPCAAAAAAACLCLALAGGQTLGAPINYGSHTGTDVTYLNVTEDSVTATDLPPLFGPPIVTGNSIDFNPVGFDAEAANGASDTTGARLTFQVLADPGIHVNAIQFSEAGDTTMAGNVAPGSSATATAVTAAGTLTVAEVDSQAVTPIVVPFSLTFTPSGGTYSLGTDGGGLSIFHTQWTGSANLPIDQILIANGFAASAGATRVSVDLVNTLTAASEPGTSALINKHDFGGLSVTAIIPEPAAGALAGLAGLALLGRRARRAR